MLAFMFYAMFYNSNVKLFVTLGVGVNTAADDLTRPSIRRAAASLQARPFIIRAFFCAHIPCG